MKRGCYERLEKKATMMLRMIGLTMVIQGKIGVGWIRCTGIRGVS